VRMHGYDLPPDLHALLRADPPPKALDWCGDVVRVTALEGGASSAVHAVTLRDGRDLVLRRYVRPEWLAEEPGVATREAVALELVHGLPAPRLVKLDPDGSQAGAPAVLMTRLEGAHDWRPDLAQLAALLVRIHAIAPPADALPAYSPYSLELTGPPPCSTRPDVWHQAFAVFNGPAPDHDHALIHRDFHPGNVLWRGNVMTGIVDWPNASIGAPQADIGHCRWNLARSQGIAAADELVRLTGAPYDPYWDVVAALGGFGPEHFTLTDETFLAHVLH
jgi:aminoglycoside phosphotransferase (APT) family kinase protein